MNEKLLLVKSLTLLYRESQLKEKADTSIELIRTVLDEIKAPEIETGFTTEKSIIQNLKSTILEMCSIPQDQPYERHLILQRARVDCGEDDQLYRAIEQGILAELDTPSLKRTIINLRNTISNQYKEFQISNLLARATSDFRYKREKIRDVNKFLDELSIQIESYRIKTTGKDPAVVSEVDISDEEEMGRTLAIAQDKSSSKGIYRLGWQDLNGMLQGGVRAGETVVVGALQHSYKTGFTLSMFGQIAMYNSPKTTDPNKKPLLLRISFEDEVESNLQFLYQKLRYQESKEAVDISSVSITEMSSYIKAKLSATGFHVKFMRVNPSEWTYKSFFNKIIELEAEGYVIEACMVDYLTKLPTTGCTTSTIAGADYLDLISRCRNFMSARGAIFITPWQLSTDAKRLIRAGVPEDRLVKEITGRGYFDKTQALDREYDVGILIHKFKHNKEWYLSVQWDKHRIPTIVADEKKYFILPMPNSKMPIPDDLNYEKISVRQLNQTRSNASSDLFQF